ncbi:enoyl-CoA hydratase/isomerase family protein [Sinomonas cellulolyticus]|nr:MULTISPECIES: enoyl-CoA hydratase/isomerase family protein [Sinomonas]
MRFVGIHYRSSLLELQSCERGVMAAVVKSRIVDGVGVLTLADTSRENVLSEELVGQARDVHHLFLESGVRVAILAAEGSSFCSGRDPLAVRVPGTQPAGAILIDEIERSPLAWVAAVDGRAIGAGVHLVTACMHVVAGPNARFLVPELLRGTYPRPVAAELARIIGPRRMMALMLTGESLNATSAVTLGLASEAVGAGEVGGRALARALALAALDPALLRSARDDWSARFTTSQTTA